MIFFLFSPETGFDISCKLSCMKCQILFSGKRKKIISVCRLHKSLPCMLSVSQYVVLGNKDNVPNLIGVGIVIPAIVYLYMVMFVCGLNAHLSEPS